MGVAVASGERWQRVKTVFQEAMDRPADERAAWVAAACAGDTEVRSQVEALLAADGRAGRFLAAATGAGADRASADLTVAVDRLQSALAGRFSIERELGRGGMGVVYLARDVALDRPVALKLLPPSLAVRPDFRERFLREARIAAGLSHPHIVPIHHVEATAEFVYFVMAYVDGESLGERVRRTGPMRPPEVAKLVQEVAWALAYAHSRGVVHRDVKPDNIMIDRASGRALVTDFGIARVAAQGTQKDEVLGTLRYMSPEQASGSAPVDGRSDLYSLGVTAFFALAGRVPFEGDSAGQLVAMHLAEPAPPVASVAPGIPAPLAEAVDRCLAKDPAARFATGEALAEAIADAQVTRREVAPTVRSYLGTARSGVAQMTIIGMLAGAAVSIIPDVVPSGPMIGHPLFPIFVMLTAFASVAAARQFTAARGVVRAGMDERDLAEAVASAASARDANVEYEIGRIERLGRFLARPLVRAVSLLSAAGCVALFPRALGDVVRAGFSVYSLAGGLFLLAAGGGSIAMFTALGVAPHKLLRAFTPGTSEYGRLWRAVWTGPIGRWWFRLAGAGLPRTRAVLSTAEPTEVLMGRAAQELFERLPKALRAQLGDVSEVIRSLERTAGDLRARRDEIARALAETGPPDASEQRARVVSELEEVRDGIETRLRAAVGAIEMLRLNLVRLRAGVGQADDLTASLEEARSVGTAVRLQLEAADEIDALTRAPRNPEVRPGARTPA